MTRLPIPGPNSPSSWFITPSSALSTGWNNHHSSLPTVVVGTIQNKTRYTCKLYRKNSIHINEFYFTTTTILYINIITLTTMLYYSTYLSYILFQNIMRLLSVYLCFGAQIFSICADSLSEVWSVYSGCI